MGNRRAGPSTGALKRDWLSLDQTGARSLLLLLLLLLLLWVEDGAAGYLTRFTSSEMADLESRPLKEFQEEVGQGVTLLPMTGAPASCGE